MQGQLYLLSARQVHDSWYDISLAVAPETGTFEKAPPEASLPQGSTKKEQGELKGLYIEEQGKHASETSAPSGLNWALKSASQRDAQISRILQKRIIRNQTTDLKYPGLMCRFHC